MALKTIRMQLRFLFPLVVTLIAAAYLAAPLMDRVTLRWFSRDLYSRGVLVTNALSDSVADAIATQRLKRLRPLFDRAVTDERLVAIGLCDTNNQFILGSGSFPNNLSCAAALEASRKPEPRLVLASGAVHVGVHDVMGRHVAPPAPASAAASDTEVAAVAEKLVEPDIGQDESASNVVVARLVLLHDLSFVDRRSQDTRRYLIGLIAALGLVIAFITVVVAQLLSLIHISEPTRPY